MPQRLQLSRRKGWRLPLGAKSVARPSRFGNPFTIADAIEHGFAKDQADGRIFVVQCFGDWLRRGSHSEWWFDAGHDRLKWIVEHLHELTGLDLACYCPPPDPEDPFAVDWCHAAVLLEEANA